MVIEERTMSLVFGFWVARAGRRVLLGLLRIRVMLLGLCWL